MSLPTDPNERRHHRKDQALLLTWAAVVLGGLVNSYVGDYTFVGYVACLVGCFVLGLFAVLVVGAMIGVLGDPPTRRIPAHMDPSSVSRMIERLRSISSIGLPARDRHDAQRDIDDGCSQLEAMFGKQPWIAVDKQPADQVPEHMALRSERIGQATDLGRWAADPKGRDRTDYAKHLATVLPTLVAVARDFGLDPRTLDPGTRRLPGQTLDDPVPLPELAAPVRALAREWLEGDNATVPTLERITADTAATGELDALEAAWAQARASNPPEEIDTVDASFRRGVDRISAALSDAIALRARSDRDVLDTNVRFLDSKHATAA